MACYSSSGYDENLMDNVFFQTLQNEFNELFLKIISEGCIICVPRIGSLSTYLFDLEDFLVHILVPTDELPESHFRNLCDTEIKVSNGIITVDHEVGRQSSIHILFQETFYTKDGLKYKVLCVEQPFDEGIKSLECKSGVMVLNTLRDCLYLLWTESGTHETIANIDKEITEFLNRNYDIGGTSLQRINDSVGSLYVKCTQILMKNTNIKKKVKGQKQTLNNLKLAVETYMQHGIYKKIMKGITACTAYEDAHLNKIIRNFSDLHFKDLNIKTEFHCSIPKARIELSKIGGYSTTLGKLGCLKRTVGALSEPHKDKAVLNADDLLQVLAFLIIKSNTANWNAQLRFLKLFKFSNASNFDENNFFITSLEAAIAYVQAGIFHDQDQDQIESLDKVRCEKNLKNYEIQSLKTLNEKASAKEKSISQFFQKIALGDFEKVKEILETAPNTINNYSSLNLCHPLCTCEKCCSILYKNICDTTPSVKSCDDQGLTALHVASMYGFPNLVEYFLAHGADPNASDCDGKTPVHYAALRGHQNALLLLIHNNADINAIDNSVNSPLHLCANNGHESCVKALLYFSEHLEIALKINQQNIRGDTALHNAAKWGYLSIVKILLEHGADPAILNKRKFSPIDYAHNVKVSELLKQKCQSIRTYIKIKPQSQVFDLEEQGNENSKNRIFKGVQPHTLESIKKVEKVLRAVENGDINLVSYYMGIGMSDFGTDSNTTPETTTQNNNEIKKCHPLCLCARCKYTESENSSVESRMKPEKRKGLNINICDSEGYTPLHVAAKQGHLDLVKGFISNGAQLNVQTCKLVTPLMLAVQNQKLNIVKELLNSGCKIDMQDYKLNTALHYACYTGNTKLVETLLKYEPNVNLKNIENKTVLQEARDKLSVGIIQALKGGKPFDLGEF